MDMPNISAVQEDYLEAIITLEKEHGRVRVRDLAEKLGVHKSTVTAALKMLTEKGLIDYAPYGRIVLQAEGRDAAQRVAGRHVLLRKFLQDVLLLDAVLAENNACRMEHVMDPAVLLRIEQFYSYLHEREAAECKWFSGFKAYLEQV
jgi:DtxR family transcriptional regulator, Mn-dependent transcriptional regulator